MTVWTQVTLSEVNGWLADHYGLQANRIIPIAEGVEDSVFRLDVGHNDAVFLRLFERTEPFGPLMIASSLAQAGLPTCPPIKDKDGNVFSTLKGKPAALSPWIDGSWVASPNLEQIAAIGSFMGRIARVGTEYCDGWHRDNPRGWEWFSETTNKLLPVLPAQQAKELKEETEAQIAFWGNIDRNEVKHGPIHADLFRNNVMFRKDGKLAAVIDWGFCASDYPLIYDLAIVANDWCLKDGGHVLDDVRLSVLMSARKEICPLTAAEEKSWGMALRLAALRFYLSRQHDASFPRDEAGKTLDPQHFYKILAAHKAADTGTKNCTRPHFQKPAGKGQTPECL